MTLFNTPSLDALGIPTEPYLFLRVFHEVKNPRPLVQYVHLAAAKSLAQEACKSHSRCEFLDKILKIIREIHSGNDSLYIRAQVAKALVLHSDFVF